MHSTAYPLIAVLDAATRALEGMTGTSVDFALILVSGCKRDEDYSKVESTLRKKLPKVTGGALLYLFLA
jgi:hypothetical protein